MSPGSSRAFHRLIHSLVFALVAFATVAQAAEQPSIIELKRNAALGDGWAQLNLGAAYDNGLGGLKKNPEQAVYWYRRAALKGIDKAQFNLAHCLATGHGTRQDYKEARFWMARAAIQGMADAQYLMGVMLAEGLGGSRDPKQARAWLEKAVAQGHGDATDFLAKLPPPT